MKVVSDESEKIKTKTDKIARKVIRKIYKKHYRCDCGVVLAIEKGDIQIEDYMDIVRLYVTCPICGMNIRIRTDQYIPPKMDYYWIKIEKRVYELDHMGGAK
jgi:hypothetical protein